MDQEPDKPVNVDNELYPGYENIDKLTQVCIVFLCQILMYFDLIIERPDFGR